MFGYQIGENVKHKLSHEFQAGEAKSRTRHTFHDCKIDGFSKTQIKLKFPNGYTKFVKPCGVIKLDA